MMQNDEQQLTPDKVPRSYENWRARIDGIASHGAYEYPLYTDAEIVGNDLEYGPYLLLNAFAWRDTSNPSIVLRIESHQDPSVISIDHETNTSAYHGGELNDEITALVSLCLGIRLKSGSCSRNFPPHSNNGLADVRGRPLSWPVRENPILMPPVGHKPILPFAIGEHFLPDAMILERFPKLTPQDATALVRAARMYQDALWMAETQPEFAWLMFVMAVESAAVHWRRTNETPIERLRASRPELEHLLVNRVDEAFAQEVAEMIAPYMGVTAKFRDFILVFLPEPPHIRPPESFRHSWARADIKKSMEKIYKHRSDALHAGVPFPLPMCMAPYRFDNPGEYAEKPLGVGMQARNASWLVEDTPMLLHTFEYIARHALLKWWGSMLPPQN